MAKKETALTPLPTRWGEKLDRQNPLPEYPRPQLARENWQNLNGIWEYAITPEESAAPPARFDGEIVVPFSPEALLSGVMRQLLPGQTLWYRRDFTPRHPAKGRVVLHFGAVDQCCSVYLNGKVLGRHAGGYWPFSFDITDALRAGANTLALSVTDASNTGIHAWGKQCLRRGNIWYTAQSGIWQTVWLEYLPEHYLNGLRITPLYDESAVDIELAFSGAAPRPARIRVLDGGVTAAQAETACGAARLELPYFKPWHPGHPFLYDVEITSGDDTVRSYFGMRKFGVGPDINGVPRLLLNNEPLFHTGLLDQGYWSDGLYTPPSDEAMIWDIETMKSLGFNMLRKHIKIEPLRWYYHCDRLGMLVWQDFVSGGQGPYRDFITRYLPFVGIPLSDTRGHARFGRGRGDSRAQFETDARRTVELLYNCVSLAVWVPFNEGWGQFDADRICDELRAQDPTRPIDHASGWYDQGGGDFYSKHIYFRKYRFAPDKIKRAVILSEFGGYSCPAPGHMTSPELYGYKMYPDSAALSDAVEELYRREVLPVVPRGLAASVYTQLSDVEDEINGLVTADRALVKIDADKIRRVNRALIGE